MYQTLALVLTVGLALSTVSSMRAQAAPDGVTPPAAAEDEVAADFEVPGGWFFTQALPGRVDGRGFAVQDGHGAPLWSGFEAADGLATLGYPISSRFEWDGRVAQAFAGGVLLWDATVEAAEILPLLALPRGRPPLYATQPDLPPVASGEAATTPWSGWWWPASDGIGPTLYAPSGPLAKYDRLVEELTGENPGTRAWERAELYFPAVEWAGHCNGWAAASLLEPEPTDAQELLGIKFTPGDLKGLLSSYHFADAAAWVYGNEAAELSPADFHRQLLRWIGGGQKGFVITFDLGRGEVWSYPAYRFESSWGLDPHQAGRWLVRTTVWMADNEVRPEFIGLKPYPRAEGQVFEYFLDGDPRNPDAGEWTGRSVASSRLARPASIWYPEPALRNLERQLASPNLLIEQIYAIKSPQETEAPTED